MLNGKKIKNYAKGGDERIMLSTGRSAIITLIIGFFIFIIEMVVKYFMTNNIKSIIWEASLLILMSILFGVIFLLNKIPIKK